MRLTCERMRLTCDRMRLMCDRMRLTYDTVTESGSNLMTVSSNKEHRSRARVENGAIIPGLPSHVLYKE